MIEKVKKAIDERERLKKEFEQAEREIVETLASYGVIGIRVNHQGIYEAQVFGIEPLEELADGIELEVESRWSEDYEYRVFFEKGGITFMTILTKKGYESHFEKEHETEEAQATLTENKRGKTMYEMKHDEVGHKIEDFL